MDITELFTQDMRASCQEQREGLTSSFFYENEAPQLLASAMLEQTSGRSILVVSDIRTRAAAGDCCIAALNDAGWTAQIEILPDGDDGSSPACDDHAFDMLLNTAAETDAYVAAGSGVVNDLTKWLAAERDKPYAVLATAASMNGYTAANVAPAIDGVKSLCPARAPRIVAADPRVVCNAPVRLTTAGLGDVVAKPVSTPDWLMNHVVFGEDYSQDIADIITGVEPLYLERPEAIRNGEASAIEALFRALILSGCAMTLQGSSLPASGGEHLISHTLDMKAHVEDKSHDLHGRQVGVATVFAAALYERVLEIESPKWESRPLNLDRAYWGKLEPAVSREYSKAVERAAGAAKWLRSGSNWDTLRAHLKPMLRDPAAIRQCLREAGGAWRVEDIGCSREDFVSAVRNAVTIRERFTALGLGFITGLLPGAIDELTDEWLL